MTLQRKIVPIFMLGISWLAPAAWADPAADESALRRLLDEFLARVADVDTHERFWDEDLVYTSSNGTRMGKPAIIEGMRSTDTGDAPQAAGPVYKARDVDVRMLGDTAIVAFRLVADGPGTGEHSEYFNTGTFVRRGNDWRAIAWQATRIPAAADPSDNDPD